MRGEGGRVLLLLHGTGGDEGSLVPLAAEVDPGASLLAVRGKVLENGMPRFFRRFAEGVFDVDDLRFRTAELAGFIGWASSRYGFSLGSVTAFGYSNGANMGATLMMLRPEVLGSAILLRPTLPMNPDAIPPLRGKSVFVSAGRFDSMVPAEGTLALVELLKSAGASLTLNWEDATHSLGNGELGRVRTWLADVP